jgi:hypothetical protein
LNKYDTHTLIHKLTITGIHLGCPLRRDVVLTLVGFIDAPEFIAGGSTRVTPTGSPIDYIVLRDRQQ